MNEQDLLLTNEYIKTDITPDLPQAFNNEFRDYYLNQLNQNKESYIVEKINKLENQLHEEIFDDDNLLNTNSIKNIGINQQNSTRLQKEKKTYVSIDSRDRDLILYPKPNQFKIYLGRTFSNVKSVKLSSLEFPNTNAVINSSNNKIFWRNKEDIDNDVIDIKTNTYPVYEATVRTGSYILTSLQKEIISELQTIKRSFGEPQLFHYPDVHLDYDTDICTFRFLDLNLLNTNPFETQLGSNIVTVLYEDHPFQVGDVIYIRDAKTFSDIPTTEINSSFSVISIELNKFQIEVTTRASETKISPNGGGGTAVKVGKALDFQFLFGEYTNTVSKNLGFPQRNSSDRIDSTIKYIKQHYLVEIKTKEPHGLINSEEIVNKLITLNNVFGVAQSTNNKIVKIVDDYTILFQTANPTVEISVGAQFENNTDSNKSMNITYTNSNGNNVSVTRVLDSLLRYSGNTIFITTNYNHGLNLNDPNNTITLYDTLTKPSIDGENTIFTVLDRTNFMIEGLLEVNGGRPLLTETSESIFGRFPKRNPLHSIAFNIKEFDVTEINPLTGLDSPSKTYVRIECDPVSINYGGGFYSIFNMNEIISEDDFIQLNGILTEPIQTSMFKVISILGSNEILIEYDQGSILDFVLGEFPTVGTNYMFLLLPNHGFNKIANFQGSSVAINFNIIEMSNVLNNNGNPTGKIKIKYDTPYMFRVNDEVDDIVGILNGDVLFERLNNPYVLTSNDIISNTEIRISGTLNTDINGNQVLIDTGSFNFTENTFEITTILDHNLNSGDNVRIMETNNTKLNSGLDWYTNIVKIDNDTLKVYTEETATGSGTTGIIGMSNDFYLYECSSFDGIDSSKYINSQKFTATKIFPSNQNGKNMILFKLNGVYASESIRGGGDNVYISSLKHGFNLKQDNTENGVLHRSISLEGEQYVFLTCPTLDTLVSTGKVKDIFARISLTDNPGSVIFDAYLSNPKIFDEGSLPNLTELEFGVKLFDGSYYDFSDLNFSFTLEITEMVDYIENTNISSRRGVLEHLL